MKRVLIVYDVPGWAWHRMAQGIQKNAPEDIQVDIVSQGEFGKFNDDENRLKQYDGISQCSWVEASTAIPDGVTSTSWVASHGLEFEHPPTETSYYPPKIATQLRNKQYATIRLPNFDRLLCVSDRLTEIASTFHNDCVRVVPGVDREVFVRREERAFRDPVVIGWCGQVKGETKGYKEILEPLMKRMIGSVEWNVNLRGATDALSQDGMVDWYHSLDLFLSTSFSEGCQMPVLEALSCGVPVIGTDSGCMRECVPERHLAPAYNDSLTAKRSVDHLQRIIDDGVVFDLEYYAQKFDWKTRSREWLEAML